MIDTIGKFFGSFLELRGIMIIKVNIIGTWRN